MPDCTLVQNAGTGNNWTTENATNTYGFAGTYLRYRWNSTSAANSWFYTQGLNLDATKTYKVSYRYGGTSTTFPEKMKVAVGNEAQRDANSMSDILANYASITTTNNSDDVEFTVATSGVYYIGFNAYSAANEFYLYLDDILVEEVDGGTDPEPNTYCEPELDCTDGDLITNVTFANINNPSACSPNGYGDYTAMIADVSADSTNPISVTVGSGFSSESVSVWIDYNNNGEFEENEFTYVGTGSGSVVTGDIVIPADVADGQYRMRVRVAAVGSTLATWDLACDEEQGYGETEDYTVNISEGADPEPSDECAFEVLSNNFENGHGYINSATVAHDFQVQPNSTFTVDSFEFNAMEMAVSTAVNLTFRSDNNGTPGAVEETLTGLTSTATNIGEAFTFPVNRHVITFDTPLVFEGGADGATFWVQITVNNTGDAYWESTGILASTNVGFYSADAGTTWTPLSGGTWDGVMKLSGTIEGECHGEVPEPGDGCLTAPNGQYPATTFSPSCNGNVEVVTDLGWFGEYSVISVTAGTEYVFSTDVPTAYITIGNATGTVAYAAATGSVTWTATASENVRFYTHENDQCLSTQNFVERYIQCAGETPEPGDYCLPDPLLCDDGDVIFNVTFAGIDNDSDCSPNGYGDYTETVSPAEVEAGQSYEISMTIGDGWYEKVSMWIDFNDNGTFEESERYDVVEGDMGGTLSNTIAIPADVADGLYRMRIYLSAAGAQGEYPTDPCVDEPTEMYGEIEDYMVKVGDLGIDTFAGSGFSFYPNPVKDMLNITSKKGVENVSIFNLAGQEMLSGAKVNNGQLDVSKLTAGTYVLRVTLEGGKVETFKVIKK